VYTSAESAFQSSESIELGAGDESRFQRWWLFHFTNPGALPQAGEESAPLALNTSRRKSAVLRSRKDFAFFLKRSRFFSFVEGDENT